MQKKLLGPSGPLGVFVEYPILLRLAAICVCAEIAWATLIIVLQFHFKDDLLHGQAEQLIASRVATATLAFVLCETVFKVPMGSLADRFGPRPLIFFALSISALSAFSMMFARQWYHFVPLRGLDGLGAAALWPAMSALMALSVPREAKAAAMSVFNGAYCLGLALGPMAGLFFGHQFGNTSVFPACGVLMIIGLVIARFVLRGGVGSKKASGGVMVHAQEVAGAGTDPSQIVKREGQNVVLVKPLDSSEARMTGEGFMAGLKDVLKGKPMLVRMMLLYALSQAAVGMFANVMVVYLGNRYGIHEADLPRIIALPALFVALVALPLGRMGDSIGRPKAVWISYVLATFGMLLVACTSLMPFAKGSGMFAPPLLVFGGGLLFLVASYILGTPAWLGLTSVQVDDSRQAQALSLMQTAQGVGVVLGSALVASAGHLLTRWHIVNNALYTRLPRLPRFKHSLESYSVVPIEVWLWAATGVFFLCLIGTMIWVREPEHALHDEHKADGARQPLEMTGV